VTAIAKHIKGHVSPDLDMYHSWYISLKADFYKKASEVATIEVNELCQCWKASEVDKRAAAMKAEIVEVAKQKNHSFFYEAAADIGLQCTYKGPFDDPPILTQTGGNACTTKALALPASRRTNPPHAAKKAPTSPATPQGRPTMPTSVPLLRSADPLPTPRLRRTLPHTMMDSGLTLEEAQTACPSIAIGSMDTGMPNTEILTRVIQQTIALILT
jgi:hypothetical protein